MYKSPKFPVKRLLLVGEFISANSLPSGNSARAVSSHGKTRAHTFSRGGGPRLGPRESPKSPSKRRLWKNLS